MHATSNGELGRALKHDYVEQTCSIVTLVITYFQLCTLSLCSIHTNVLLIRTLCVVVLCILTLCAIFNLSIFVYINAVFVLYLEREIIFVSQS